MNDLSRCSKCGELKPLSSYHKDRTKASGYFPSCKECVKKKSQSWRARNRDKMKQGSKAWRERNLEYARAKHRDWKAKNRDKVNALSREYHHRKYRECLDYKGKVIVGNLLRLTLKGRVKDKRSHEMLGYTRSDLIKRIEFQFTDGMGWDNYGEWHIDHKIPINHFLKKGEDRPYIINALSNLQPMWGWENCIKSDRYIG